MPYKYNNLFEKIKYNDFEMFCPNFLPIESSMTRNENLA